MYFGIAALTGGVILLPLLLIWHDVVSRIPPIVLLYLLPTGIFQGLYFVGLAGAYRSGDLSVAYPVARAVPVLVVPLFATVLGTGSAPETLALVGMGVVAFGLLVIPGRQISGRSLAYAVLAGIGTTGYSIIDDRALAVYRAAFVGGAATRFHIVQLPIIYSAFQAITTALFLGLIGLVSLGRAGYARELRRTSLRSAGIAGVAIILAYGLVLVAYGFATNVGYVVAFRQVSLPIGTLLGITVLREKVGTARIAGTALIVSGLVLVGLG